MTLTQDLAERIHAIRYEDLPADAIPLARTAILDAVGCTFLGASEEMSRIVERTPGFAGAAENAETVIVAAGGDGTARRWARR